jgi:curli biogenesis system outer membrane secretion channel CsgG
LFDISCLNLLNSISSKLITELKLSGRYRVVEREKLDKIFKMHEFALSGAVDMSTATEAGRLLGVDAILLSSVSRINYKKNFLFGLVALVIRQVVEVSMEGCIVDVNTGEVLATAAVMAEAWDREAVAMFVFRAGGTNSRQQLETMAMEYAISSLVSQLSRGAVIKQFIHVSCQRTKQMH